MKKAMSALFMPISMFCNAGPAHAEASPVIVTHALTGSNKAEAKTTLNFTEFPATSHPGGDR